VAKAPTAELDAQYRLLREEAGVLDRPERVVLEVSGAEGAEFLQGQLTNEIESLEPGQGCYAALLDRKGKMRADMRVLRLEGDLIWVETGTGPAAEVLRHLDMYRVGRDAEVGRRDDLAVCSVIGPRATELVGERVGPEHSHRELRLAERDVRAVSTDTGLDLIGPRETLERVAGQLTDEGAERVGVEAAEILRVELGRPAFGAEMGNETIPQEAGINERAVNFEKGCYIGQETVARLHYKGRPNRHLRRLVAEEPLTTGAEVRLGEKVLGSVGTAVLSPARGPVALAILRREAEPGTEVIVGDGAPATVEDIGAEG